MKNRIDIYRKIAEIDTLLEDISFELNVLDKKEDNQVLNTEDSIKLRFLENRRDALINELHQLEIELVEKTWIEKSTIFEGIKQLNNTQNKYS